MEMVLTSGLTVLKKTVFNTTKMEKLCNIIVIDNFYKNPLEVREFALKETYTVSGNYPGKRTKSFANKELKETLQNYIRPFTGEITDFPMDTSTYNGAFQYTTSRERSWIHVDPYNSWGGVLFLTPDAPLTSGTGFYKLKDPSTDPSKFSQDLTKWDLVDQVGNVFNRLVLFNSKRYHMSMDYFGSDLLDSRLFQVFFFS
jgi:hypothetical protein